MADRKKGSALNDKQRRFVLEYLKDSNATQAAIRAGYSEATANQQGSRLLANVKIAKEIAKRQEKIEKKLECSAERVAEELIKLGFANMQDYMGSTPEGDPYLDFSKLTREQAAALQEVTVDDYVVRRDGEARDVRRVKFKLADKRAALIDLAKMLGFFEERHKHDLQHSGEVTHKLDGNNINEALGRYADVLASVARGSTSGTTEDVRSRESVDPEATD